MTYSEHGFEVFRSVLNTVEVDLLRRTVAVLCERYRAGVEAVVTAGVSLSDYTRAKPERNPGVDPDSVLAEPYILGNLGGLNEDFWHVLTLEPLWNLAADLLKVGIRQVVYHSAQVVRKPAGVGPGLSWHRDYGNTYISTAGPLFVRLLAPLQEMAEPNGGTGVVPRSHLLDDDEALRREGEVESGEGALYPWLRPGDVLALHPKTIHGGGPNRGTFDRDLLAIQFGKRDVRMLHTFDGEFMTLCSREEMLASVSRT